MERERGHTHTHGEREREREREMIREMHRYGTLDVPHTHMLTAPPCQVTGALALLPFHVPWKKPPSW